MRAMVAAAAALAACSSELPPQPGPASPADLPSRPLLPEPDPPPPPAPLAPPALHLPRALVPVAYRVRLSVPSGAADHVLGGHLEVDGDLPAPAAVIWLNGQDLAISAAVAIQDGARVPLSVHADEAVAAISLQPIGRPALTRGRWTIAIDYTAPIAEQPLVKGSDIDVARGAFRETVGSDSYVFTQLEATDARRVFPCVDEPDVKVPWTLSILASERVTVASNAAIVRVRPRAAGLQQVDFAPTQPLPSYVVAFAVGPFDVTPAGATAAGVPVRVLAPRGTLDPQLALSGGRTAARVLDALAAWTGIPYPYGKLDLVAVPRTGEQWLAMENPGLVTFAARTIQPRSRVLGLGWTGVIAHELAHQWFGDLVTPASWDDLWLSEGFAVWLGEKIAMQEDPAWAAEGADGMMHQAYVMTVTAVRRPVTTREMADDFEDSGRGGEVLRMFERFVGEDRFQAAARAYLAAHAGRSVTSADLVAAVDRASGQPLDRAFDDALAQPRAPVLAMSVACHGAASAHVEVVGEPRVVPVCIAYDHDGVRDRACAMLDGAALDVALPAKRCPRWSFVEPGAYLVPELPRRRGDFAGRDALTPLERWQLAVD